MARRPEDQAFDRYLRKRDPADLAQVFDACAPRLLLVAAHVAGAPGGAEDLVQSTFLRALQATERFERGRPVMPWLTGILIREAKDARRQAARRPDPHRLPESAVEVPADAAAALELQEQLLAAIERMPEAYRETLNLRLVHGLTPTEIAHARGLSPDTVKTHLRRGIERLRRALPVSLAPVLAVALATGRSLVALRAVVLGAAGSAPIVITGAASLGSKAMLWAKAGAIATVTTGALAWGLWPEGEEPPPPAPAIVRAPSPEVDAEDDGPRRRGVALPPVTVGEEPPAELPPEVGFASVAGRILDQNGRPLAEIPIQLLRLHPDMLLTAASGLPEALADPPYVAGLANTDGNGQFAIGGVRPGGLFLLVLDPGGRRHQVRILEHSPAPFDELRLQPFRIETPRPLSARLTDPEGRALPNVWVQPPKQPLTIPDGAGPFRACFALWHDPLFALDAPLLTRPDGEVSVFTLPEWFHSLCRTLSPGAVQTGEDGRFTWWARGTRPVDLQLQAGGFEVHSLQLGNPQRESRYGDFSLQRAPLVRGTVRAADGQPVAGATVHLGRLPGRALHATLPIRAQSDDAGNFRTHVPGTGDVVAAIRRRPGSPWVVSAAMDESMLFDLRLPRSHRLQLDLFDGERSRLEGGELLLIPGGAEALLAYQLGAQPALDVAAALIHEPDGGLVLEVLEEGRWLGLVRAPNHALRPFPFDLYEDYRRRIDLPALLETSFRVTGAGFADGVARTRLCGPPIAPIDQIPSLHAVLAETGAEGRVRLDRRRWDELDLELRANPLGSQVHRIGRGVEDLSLELPALGTLEGRVRVGSRPAHPGECLVLAIPVDESGRPRALGATQAHTTNDTDGAWHLTGLRPGPWRLQVVRTPVGLDEPGAVWSLLFPEWIDPYGLNVVVSSYGSTPIDLTAPPPPGGTQPELSEAPRRLQVRMSLRPTPIDALLYMHDGSNWQRPPGPLDDKVGRMQAVALSDGADPDRQHHLRLRLRADARGILEVDLRTQGFSAILQEAEGARAADLPVELTGRVLVDDARVLEASFQRPMQSDRGGWIGVDHLPPGTYELRAADPERGWLRREFTVGPGSVVSGMTIRLQPLLSARGRVDRKKLGRSLPSGSDILFTSLGEQPFERRADLDRKQGFTVSGLLPGRYRVTLRPARVVTTADGSVRRIPGARSGLTVPQGEVEVPESGLRGLLLPR